jgi:hypothetical protein
MTVQPHTARHGWLKNGNPPGDLAKATPCGARTRNGRSCRGPAMTNGRCRMHGGPSTGPRTPEGKERSRMANLKHGRFSHAAIAARRQLRERMRTIRELLKEMRA